MRAPSYYLNSLVVDANVIPRYRGHVLSILDRPEHVDQEEKVLKILQRNTPEWFAQPE